MIAIAQLAITGVVSAAGAASPSVPPPSADPFYASPANLASYTPGTILRRRAVTVPGVSGASGEYQLL